MGKMLEVQNLNVHYGSIHAIKDISLEVNEGEIVSLIGANGAGKTTTLHTITGIKKATSGSIKLYDQDLTAIEPHKIITLGMAHVPEGRHIFAEMTVEENLEMGAFWLKGKTNVSQEIEKVYERFPRLKERYRQPAGTLSGGEQQMLAIGRAMMSCPKMIMFDEPSLGLAPNIVAMIFRMIQEIRDQGVSILLIEQNANMALKVSDRAYVLETGRVALTGLAKDLRHDDNIRKAYLGGK